jgi:hypothetical protein
MRINSPCDHLRADAVASTTSRLAFVTIAKRPSCRDETARKKPLIWGDGEAEYIREDGWTTQIRLNPFSKLDFSRNAIARTDDCTAHPMRRPALGSPVAWREPSKPDNVSKLSVEAPS